MAKSLTTYQLATTVDESNYAKPLAVAPVIAKYVNYHPTRAWPEGSHYYRVPILNLKGVRVFVSFDNPCILCGLAQEDGIHKVVGDARVG